MKKVLKVILIIIAVLVAAFFLLDAWLGDYTPKDEREYTEVTVDQLYEEFDDNPLNAKEKYTDAYVALTGYMRVIDSDGDSISLYPLEYETLDGVNCRLTSDDQREVVKGLSKGDNVTVKGQITEVDGIYRYKMDVDSIEVE